MQNKLISENKVLTGKLNKFIDFNHEEFQLVNSNNQPLKFPLRKFRYHQFNFLGINTPEYRIGLGLVKLGYFDKVFGYLLNHQEGIKFKWDKIIPTFGPSTLFSADQPDIHTINYNSSNSSVLVSKNLPAGTLNVDFNIKNRLQVNGFFEYSMANNPLRIINSLRANHLAFTEKSNNIQNKYLQIAFDGKTINTKPEETYLIYDFTAGYLKRITHWYWSAFSGKDSTSERTISGNFAINNNYKTYTENALWIGNKRFDFNEIKFEFQNEDFSKEWYLYSLDSNKQKDNRLEMVFTPNKNHYMLEENINLCIIQSFFKQYFGEISGTLKDQGEKITFNNLSAISEKHFAKW